MTGGPDQTLSGRRALVVEDERLIALDVRDMLVGWGCAVLGPVATVEEALEMIAEDPPDFAVLDVHLDGETSEPVAAVLRDAERPFLVLTAYRSAHLAGAHVEAPLLPKPVDERKLRREVFCLLTDGAGR